MTATVLPQWYAGTPVVQDDDPVSTDVELCRTLAQREARLGYRPTVLFRNLAGRPGQSVLGNPYPLPVVLAALGTTREDRLRDVAHRLRRPGHGWKHVDPPVELRSVAGLDALPVVRHRPGDAGPYITAGICATTSPGSTDANLGVYRIQVVSGTECRIFLDPRTDGHRNMELWHAQGEPMPITVFLGANPVYFLVAAARLPAESDYDVASRLLGRPVELARDTLVPADATHVISGRVLARTAAEGPFGEFKGFYAEQRSSNVMEVTAVTAAPGSAYPTIVAGAESGLTMMSLQNELLMYTHLTESGFPVDSVRYPLDARGEFLTLIETPKPSDEMLERAMRFDVRTKVVVCGPDLTSVWQSLAVYGFTSRTAPYLRKGVVHGERVGLVLTIPPDGRPVEF